MKSQLRKICLSLRDAIPLAEREAASAVISAACLAHPALSAGAKITAYWPSNSEVDCRPLIQMLYDKGHSIGLPLVAGKEEPLLFRTWHPDTPMQRGVLNIATPPQDAPLVEPDLLFVPLLAFNRQGYRLGYGGGYYDRTLAALRKIKKITAIGMAYAIQEQQTLPYTPFDAPLDGIVTEKETIVIDR